MPAPGSADTETYNEWLHYSEGSAMLPLMLNLYVGRSEEAAAPFLLHRQAKRPTISAYEKGREFFVGQLFSGADIQTKVWMSAPENDWPTKNSRPFSAAST